MNALKLEKPYANISSLFETSYVHLECYTRGQIYSTEKSMTGDIKMQIVHPLRKNSRKCDT